MDLTHTLLLGLGLPGHNTGHCNTHRDIHPAGHDRRNSHFVDTGHRAGRRSTLCDSISCVSVSARQAHIRFVVIGIAVTLLVVVVVATLVIVVLAVLVIVVVTILALLTAVAVIVMAALRLLCRHGGVGLDVE